MKKGFGSWCDVAEGAGENMNASQFYFTLGSNLDSLDEKHTIFGEVTTALNMAPASADKSANDLSCVGNQSSDICAVALT